MRILLFPTILTLVFISCKGNVTHRTLREGEGINFPRRPLTRTAAEKYVRYFIILSNWVGPVGAQYHTCNFAARISLVSMNLKNQD